MPYTRLTKYCRGCVPGGVDALTRPILYINSIGMTLNYRKRKAHTERLVYSNLTL